MLLHAFYYFFPFIYFTDQVNTLPVFSYFFSERFGDGDTSQIGLDLEEVIFFMLLHMNYF